MLNDGLKRKLLFRATHRGIREMDIVLGRYCAEHLPRMNADQATTFMLLLNFNDQPMYQALSEDGENTEEKLSALTAGVSTEMEQKILLLLRDIWQWMRAHPYRGENTA
ncbi:MAG: succinate dehydrogenase assembly factor 2 [Alphaproteobacteria bacterium]|nr:succinate dehydrogenase assembly factor 2 [Alphaproteobacteria bacterium]